MVELSTEPLYFDEQPEIRDNIPENIKLGSHDDTQFQKALDKNRVF